MLKSRGIVLALTLTLLIGINATFALAQTAQTTQSAQTVVRPYGNIGALFTSPSATALGYGCVNCDVSVWNLTYSRASFGLGAQVLFGSPRPVRGGVWSMRTGVDVGWQKQFSEQGLVPDDPPGTYTTNDVSAFNLLGLLEFRRTRSPVFFQAGAGLDIYSIGYSAYANNVSHDSFTSSSKGLRVLGGAGMDAYSNGKITVPIVGRLSYLSHYNCLTVSAIVGVTFTR